MGLPILRDGSMIFGLTTNAEPVILSVHLVGLRDWFARVAWEPSLVSPLVAEPVEVI